MASRGFNIQQVPNDERVLRLFRAAPGHRLIGSDLASVEPRVVAFFSRDSTLLELYASGKEHDVYLYLAMHIFPDQAAAIKAVYYLADGVSTTAESISAAKRAFAKYRKIAKEVQLACGYGASAWKVWQTLQLKGVVITLAECEALVRLYWVLFAGVRRWTRVLERECQERGGWILNGRGRPIALPEHRLKDAGNAFAQSTGHDCLLTLVWHLARLRRERRVLAKPWHVNQHDASIWMAPDAHVDATVRMFEDAYQALNDELGADVKLTGDITVGDSLWSFKEGT